MKEKSLEWGTCAWKWAMGQKGLLGGLHFSFHPDQPWLCFCWACSLMRTRLP